MSDVSVPHDYLLFNGIKQTPVKRAQLASQRPHDYRLTGSVLGPRYNTAIKHHFIHWWIVIFNHLDVPQIHVCW